MHRTLHQIRTEGLTALRDRLGRAGMIRFLQQFETGAGTVHKERDDEHNHKGDQARQTICLHRPTLHLQVAATGKFAPTRTAQYSCYRHTCVCR
jgi:hypothetical protein